MDTSAISFSCTSSVVSPAQLQLPVCFFLTKKYSSSYSFPVAVSHSCLPFLILYMWICGVCMCIHVLVPMHVCVSVWRDGGMWVGSKFTSFHAFLGQSPLHSLRQALDCTAEPQLSLGIPVLQVACNFLWLLLAFRQFEIGLSFLCIHWALSSALPTLSAFLLFPGACCLFYESHLRGNLHLIWLLRKPLNPNKLTLLHVLQKTPSP